MDLTHPLITGNPWYKGYKLEGEPNGRESSGNML